jgi:hypothetical protein
MPPSIPQERWPTLYVYISYCGSIEQRNVPVRFSLHFTDCSVFTVPRFERVRVRISDRIPITLTEASRGYPSFVKVNAIKKVVYLELSQTLSFHIL